ncbi:MAG: hypothetical protein K5920_08605, partial [Bacteroidales bacterium]|nr:hypothetical protein [Bacteroidales bacterium]
MFSPVEQHFFIASRREAPTTSLSYLVSESVPRLGLMLSMCFLEWVQQHPEGCVSLPIGKSASDFINNTHKLLDQWDSPEIRDQRLRYGLLGEKPSLRGLCLVQMGEYYPISPLQHNSLYNFVHKEYI